MPVLEWKDSYSVGSLELDNDHKNLIDIIKRLDESERTHEPVGWLLKELGDYADGHFRREEEALAAANFPELEEHRLGHKDFIDWLVTVRSTFSIEPESQYYLAETVNDYLKKWLTSHILEKDMDYKEYLK